jgi:hypothetical protein
VLVLEPVPQQASQVLASVPRPVFPVLEPQPASPAFYNQHRVRMIQAATVTKLLLKPFSLTVTSFH